MRNLHPSAFVCALLVACAAASQPTPAETAAVARASIATLAGICARMPADAPRDVATACAALAKADGVVAEVCPEMTDGGSGGGSGGAK